MKILLLEKNIKSVLILEDAPERVDWFKKTFDFVDDLLLFITKDTDIAFLRLLDTKFDIIFLDHDLDEAKVGVQNYEDTGLFIADRLKTTINKETTCIIHSMNPIGAALMVKAHPFNTAHIPFSMLHDSLEVR